jgi:hypothetical protein
MTGPGYLMGVRAEAEVTSSATAGVETAEGVGGVSTNSSAQTLQSAVGLHGESRNFSTGTITTASALEGAIWNTGGGTITNAKILNVLNPQNTSGTITNAYGLYVNVLDAATSNWPIYVSDGAGDAHFAVTGAGKVGIGTDAPGTKLEVKGNVKIGANTYAAEVQNIFHMYVTYDFPATAAQSSSDMVAVIGVTTNVDVGDAVIVAPDPAAIVANSSYTAWISNPGEITLRFNNYSSASQNPSSGTFWFTIIEH